MLVRCTAYQDGRKLDALQTSKGELPLAYPPHRIACLAQLQS